MKINLSTRPQDVIATLEREWQMAVDAYIEHEGGKKVYDRKQDGYLAVAEKAKENFIPATFLWQSPDGNKWCVFEHTTFDSGYAHTCSYAFCYYLTFGFGGVFFKFSKTSPVTNQKTVGYICYESHFFERLHERGLYEWRGIDTLKQFIADNHGNMIYGTDIDSHKVDIRIGTAIGRGFRHRDYPQAYYIKTVLDDSQLTRTQRKTTAFGRRLGDTANKYTDLPPSASVEREWARCRKAHDDGKVGEYKQMQIRDLARLTGVSQESAREIYYLYALLYNIVLRLKPSVSCNLTSDQIHVFHAKSMELLKGWNGEEVSNLVIKTTVTNAVLAISKQLGWSLTRSGVLRSVHEIMNI